MKNKLYVGTSVVMLVDGGFLYHKNQVGTIVSKDTDGHFWVWFDGQKPTEFNGNNWPINGGNSWCASQFQMKNRAASF